jgi:hypothetical protein
MLLGGKLTVAPTPVAPPLMLTETVQPIETRHDSAAAAAVTWEVVVAPPSGAIEDPVFAVCPR